MASARKDVMPSAASPCAFCRPRRVPSCSRASTTGRKLSPMPARTGQQYIDSLKRMSPCIYLNGRLVSNVTEEPVFQGAIKSIAELYDLQHDPRYRDFMPVSYTHLTLPTSDLV